MCKLSVLFDFLWASGLTEQFCFCNFLKSYRTDFLTIREAVVELFMTDFTQNSLSKNTERFPEDKPEDEPVHKPEHKSEYKPKHKIDRPDITGPI